MSDQERIKRFIAEGDANNREIFENLVALRGEFRAKITSELTNIRLYMTALTQCTCYPDIDEAIMQTGVALSATLCRQHGWNPVELMADIDMMFNARALRK